MRAIALGARMPERARLSLRSRRRRTGRCNARNRNFAQGARCQHGPDRYHKRCRHRPSRDRWDLERDEVLDCFAEFTIGPATSGRARWLAMTKLWLTENHRALTRGALQQG